MKSMSANGDPSPVDGATGRSWGLRLPVIAPRRSGPSRFGDSGQTRRDGAGGHAVLRRSRPPQPDTASGEHQNDVSHSRNRRKVLKVRKPKEGSGRSRWQHRERQRARQWSKALWPAGYALHPPWQHGRRDDAIGRREGRGRGDAVRLLARRSLRRVWRHGEGVSWKRVPASSSTAREGARPRQRLRQRGQSPDEPSNAGSAATHGLSLCARRRAPEVRDEAGRREQDQRTGQPVWWSQPSPADAGLTWLASQGRQFGPQGPGQMAPRWQHHRARSEAPDPHSSETPETWRTPGSAAGCNKPAGRRAE
jgi:hypothetical protein